jgi:hypothetical protein
MRPDGTGRPQHRGRPTTEMTYPRRATVSPASLADKRDTYASARRRASRALDLLLGCRDTRTTYRRCDGSHHPGLPCDWWGSCSGASYTAAEHRWLRAGVAP